MQKKAPAAAPAKSAQKAARPTPAKSAAPGARAGAAKARPEKAEAARTHSAGDRAGARTQSAKAEPVKAGAKAVKATAKEPAPTDVAKKAPAAKPAREATKTVTAKKADVAAPTKPAGGAKTKAKGDRAPFFAKQRELLLEERRQYMSSAEALKAQADSLALEHEPGDVQFDEEGGEGGTANVDREIDLYLSAQARATVVEIDRALQKIEDGVYGVCEQCGSTIPEARLQALPYAALCVTCKSGGLSSRR